MLKYTYRSGGSTGSGRVLILDGIFDWRHCPRTFTADYDVKSSPQMEDIKLSVLGPRKFSI